MNLDSDVFNPATTISFKKLEAKIIAYLFKNPRKTITEIANDLGENRQTVYKTINKLKARWIVEPMYGVHLPRGGAVCAPMYCVNMANAPYLRWPEKVKQNNSGIKKKQKETNGIPKLHHVIEDLISRGIISECSVDDVSHSVTITFTH